VNCRLVNARLEPDFGYGLFLSREVDPFFEAESNGSRTEVPSRERATRTRFQVPLKAGSSFSCWEFENYDGQPWPIGDCET